MDAQTKAQTARWRYEVFRGMTLLGYTDWLAWREADQEEAQYTTPEDVVEMGPAIQAVRRGFADMEAQIRASEKETDA